MLTYADGKYTIDEAALPAITVQRMLQTATNHILGNEVSSQVVGKIRAMIAGEDGKVADVTTEQVKAFREVEANHGAIADWEHEYRTARIKSMLEGTLTVRASGSGTSRDPVESAMRAIAKLEISAILGNNGAKFPGKDAPVTLAGKAYTADDLLSNRLAHAEYGPRIRKEAERKVAADKRLRDNARKAGVADGTELAQALGL